ncbi:MAG: TonB family protein [Pseudomonadota bacterium]
MNVTQTDVEINTVLDRDMLPVENNRSDRLPPMIFLATLFYALLILGITFDIGLPDDDNDVTSLEVTIVTETDLTAARPDKADYLAQANQQGNGNTREKVSPGAAPMAPGQVDMPVDDVGPVQREQSPGEVQPERLLTTTGEADRQIAQPDDISDEPSDVEQIAKALPQGLEQTLPLPESENPSLLITDDDPRHLIVSVNSRQSDIAPYLAAWKQRVERVGTMNFPRDINIDGLTGDPTLSVTIAPDGRLTEVQILRSSGYEQIDRAAMLVLNRASPFEAFPSDLKSRYDKLSFAYKFKFEANGISGAAFSSDGS